MPGSSGRKRRNQVEQGIQRACARYLDLALIPPALWWHTPNGGGRTLVEASVLKGMGVKAGIPDIVVFHRVLAGWTIMAAIELKATEAKAKRLMKEVDSGLPSEDDQVLRLRQLKRLGFHVAACWSPECVELGLRAAGIPLRATLLGLPVVRQDSTV